MHSRRTAVLGTVLVGALAVSACGSSKKSTATSPAASGSGGASSSTGSSGGSGGSKPTYTIGFQGPLTVNSPQLGINGLDGVITAVDEANKKGDLPFTLKVKKVDDQGTPDQGPTAAQSLVDDKSVVAVVGPMFSGATKASEPIFSGANLLSVTPSATNPKLTSDGFTTFFRAIPSDIAQGKGSADYIVKVLKAKKVFSLDDKSEYGTGLATSLDGQLKTDGASVTHDGINPTKDYTSEADKIISDKPDLLYYSGYYQDFALLAKALKGKGFTGTLMSGDGSNDDQYIVQAGKATAEGTYLTCACGDANSDPKAASFVAAYKADNGGAIPGTYSGEAFDSTNAVISVLKQLGASGINRKAVATAFKSVDVVGVTKTIQFQPNGEIQGNTVFIYQVKNGKRTLLGPTTTLIKS